MKSAIPSQSLRTAELDARREVGLVLRDPPVVRKLIETFESDWTTTSARKSAAPPKETDMSEAGPAGTPDKEAVTAKDTQKAVQVFTKELDPLAVSVKKAVRKAVAKA